jgi:hypothetical protein
LAQKELETKKTKEGTIGKADMRTEQSNQFIAIDALARILYEKMERLAPGAGEYVAWDELPEWERDLHRHGIEAVLEDRDLLFSAVPFAGDDVINGCIEERK